MKSVCFVKVVSIVMLLTICFVSSADAGRIAQWTFGKPASLEYGDLIVHDYDLVAGLDANSVNTSETAYVFYAASPSYLPGSAADIRGGAFLNVADDPILTGHDNGGSGFTGFSIDVYFNLRSLPGSSTNPASIVRKTGSGTSTNKNRPGYQLYVTYLGELKFYLNDWFYVSSGATVSSAENSIQASQWYHVTATWDGAVMKLYIDEELVASLPYTSYNDDGVLNMNTEGDLGIGGWKTLDSTYAQYINGVIDNLTLYNEAIEPTLCGRWGYSTMDFNRDCYVDLSDLAILASEWAVCTMPYEDGCVER